MSAGDFGPQVVAFQALCALDAYEQAIRGVMENWLDMDAYAGASHELDRLRSFITGMPGLAAPWVTVLISHTELIHGLWRCERENVPVSDVEHQILADHLQAVQYLKSRCRRLMPVARPH